MGRSLATLAALIAALASFSAVASCLGERKPLPGEVMVVVTTDMSVQGQNQDFDSVRWTVSFGDRIDAGSGSFDAASLPATLGIASGRDPSAPVTISVDALMGSTTLVHRENTLPGMPIEGVKTLSMPLDYLCRLDPAREQPDASSLACRPGMTTCGAGECVPSRVTSPLPDYVAAPRADCSGALDYCFASAALVTPTWDPAIPGCAVPIANGTQPVNVALNVNDDFGTCTNVGCFIPLEGESEEGWRTLSDGGPGSKILLPRAVCDDIDGGTITNVAITTDCPTKGVDTPLCPRSVGCVASTPVHVAGCSSSLGYECSGPLNPHMRDLKLSSCTTQNGSASDYCCYVGQKTQAGTLIDDMSGDGGLAPQVQFPPLPGNAPGRWFPPSLMFTSGGACSTNSTTTEGFDLQEAPDGGMPPALDATLYSGVSFWAFSPYAGQLLTVHLQTVGCTDLDANVGCASETKTLTTNWARYDVSWVDLAAQGFDRSKLVGVSFEAPPPAFKFCISQVYFNPP